MRAPTPPQVNTSLEILLIVPVNERGVKDMNKELVGFESAVSIGTCYMLDWAISRGEYEECRRLSRWPPHQPPLIF